MLERHGGEIGPALIAWEQKLRPFITGLQQNGLRMRALFTPSGELQRILRAGFLRLAGSPITRPLVQKLAVNDLNMRDIAASDVRAH
jgi:hypothetical protein